MDDTQRQAEIQKAKRAADKPRDRYGYVGIVGSLIVVLILVVAILQLVARVGRNASTLNELKREVPTLQARIAQLEDENRVLRQNLDAVSQQLVERGVTPNVTFPPGFVNPPQTATTTTSPPTTSPPTTSPPTTTTTAPPSTTSTTACLLPAVVGCFR